MLRKFVKPVGGLLMGWTLLTGGEASAQTSGYVAPPPTLGPPVAGQQYAEPGTTAFANPASDCAPGVWISFDYMVWWLKAAPAPGPLVTTGSILDPFPGALGQPNTRVVFGNDSISNNAFNGLRVQAGTWIDEARTVGYEAGGFALERRTAYAGISSDANGVPFLARPIFNTQTNREEAILLSAPGFQSGGLFTGSTLHFSGWDFNFAVNGTDTGNFRADGLLGFRALYLAETLSINNSVTALVTQGVDESSLQQGERLGVVDRFGTSSNFYGGQIGGRMTWLSDRWLTTATLKVALGVTDQLAILDGVATARGDGLTGSGYLVNSANAGRYFTNTFSVVPELGLNVGYRVSQYATLRLGYTLLYWSDVVRPGNVVTHAINPSLVPNLQGFGVGPATPGPRAQIDSTDFWAQGLNLGIEFRF